MSLKKEIKIDDFLEHEIQGMEGKYFCLRSIVSFDKDEVKHQHFPLLLDVRVTLKDKKTGAYVSSPYSIYIDANTVNYLNLPFEDQKPIYVKPNQQVFFKLESLEYKNVSTRIIYEQLN